MPQKDLKCTAAILPKKNETIDLRRRRAAGEIKKESP